MLSQKRSIFPLHPLTESLPESVFSWSLDQMEGRREAGRSWRRGTAASLSLQPQQWISCNAELHSIIWLINSWSNPLLPGFWHIFLFWGASQQFAKSTGLYRALPIPDRKVIHSELFWGDPRCTSWNQTSFVPWRGALPQWHWCKVWP